MALRVRFQYPPGASLGYSVERLADGFFYDFAAAGPTAGTFTPSPSTPVAALPGDSGNFTGRYKVTLSPTPASQFLDGDYCVTIHNTAATNAVIAEMGVVMRGGDDATPIVSPPPDPWAQALPAGYAAGTAGALLGSNLDAKVSSRLAASSYAAPPTPPSVAQIASGVWDEPKAGHAVAGSFGLNLDVAVSSRLAASAYSPPPTDYQQRNQPVVLPALAPAWYSSPPTDYQQRNQPVTLPTTPPAGYGATGGLSVAQIVSAVWDEPRAGHAVAGSFATCLDASISSRLAAAADTPGTTTLLARLSAARAAYLDALNVSGTVASHADVAAVGNNTLVRIFVPDVVQRPLSGSISRIVHLYTYDEMGNMATPDSPPTISAVNGSGASRNANLDSPTMTNVSAGHYRSAYTLNASDPTEQLVWGFTVVQGGRARQYGATTEVVDVMSVNFNSNDRANLNALVAMAGTTGVMVDSACMGGLSLSAEDHSAITADAIAALNAAIPASPTPGSVFDRIDARVSAPVVVGQNNDKAGYALAASGLDAVPVEAGINARQALAPILAASAGVISGAGSGTVAIKGGNVATTRILAATDADGNRTSVALTLPN